MIRMNNISHCDCRLTLPFVCDSNNVNVNVSAMKISVMTKKAVENDNYNNEEETNHKQPPLGSNAAAAAAAAWFCC